MMPPRRLLFSGGGVRALSFVGCLEECERSYPSYRASLKEVCGVSAGSLFALLVAIGYSVDTLRTICLEFDFEQLPSLDTDDFLQAYEQLGLDTGERLERFIKSLLKHRGFAPETTFADLASKAIPVRVWATNIQTLEPVEFSVAATPTLPVWIGLRASMAFPLYFTPVHHPETGEMLVDGGVVDNFPMGRFSESERNETWGFAFDFEADSKDIHSLFDLLPRCITGLSRLQHKHTLTTYRDRCVVIRCLEFPALHFQATQEQREILLEKGREAMRAFLQGGSQHMYKGRRRSVS